MSQMLSLIAGFLIGVISLSVAAAMFPAPQQQQKEEKTCEEKVFSLADYCIDEGSYATTAARCMEASAPLLALCMGQKQDKEE